MQAESRTFMFYGSDFSSKLMELKLNIDGVIDGYGWMGSFESSRKISRRSVGNMKFFQQIFYGLNVTMVMFLIMVYV